MGVFVGDCAVIQVADFGKTVTLDIERIEGDTAYFGNCRGGIVSVSSITLEEGDVLVEGAIVEAVAYWRFKDKCYPLKLTVGEVRNGFVRFKSCEGSVPVKFLTDSEDVQIWGRVER